MNDSISTADLLLEEIRQSRNDYNNTMKAIAKTDKQLAVTTSELSGLTKKLEDIPESCIREKLNIASLESRLDQTDEKTGLIANRQTESEKVLGELKANSRMSLKTLEGWRKLLPYLILGGVSLWGFIQKALSAVSS